MLHEDLQCTHKPNIQRNLRKEQSGEKKLRLKKKRGRIKKRKKKKDKKERKERDKKERKGEKWSEASKTRSFKGIN